jgi:hypothetical protein
VVLESELRVFLSILLSHCNGSEVVGRLSWVSNDEDDFLESGLVKKEARLGGAFEEFCGELGEHLEIEISPFC